MSRFTRVLGEVAGRLNVSEPARSRILLELTADMEGLFRAYLERGRSEEEAHREALEQFDLSDEALRELERIHDSPLQRSLETLSGQVRGTGSRVLLGILALTVAVGAGPALLQRQLYQDASALVWVLVPLLLGGLVLVLGKSYRLFGPGVSWSPDLKRGLGYLPALALLQILMAALGLWVELFRTALRARSAPSEALIHLVDWIHASAATMIVALTGAIILGCLWFFLTLRAQQIETAAAARILEVAP